MCLALFSGFLFTFNNFVLKEYQLDFVDALFVRAIVQIIILAAVIKLKGLTIWPPGASPSLKITILVLIQVS